MGADERPHDVWTDLVGGLLDARTDPVTARFDQELTAAVEAGRLPEDTAHRLRFWQRASVRAAADHARTVMPVALGALEAARTDALRYAEEAAAVLGPAAGPAPEAPAADEETPVAGEAAAGAEVDGMPIAKEGHVAPTAPRPDTRPPTAAEQAWQPTPATAVSAERRASTHDGPEPSSLGAPSLVILADLTQVEPRT